MKFSNNDIERILDTAISNKIFYRRLLEYGLDINEVFYKIRTRPLSRWSIRLDDSYRDDQGMLRPTVIRWYEKYFPEKFKDVNNTIEALSSACQSSILTEREKYMIEMIKERVCKKYELYRDQDVKREWREVKEQTPKTHAQCDTEVLSPLFEGIWRITECINERGMDVEGRAERYYKKDVIEFLACLLQATDLANMWAFVSGVNEDRDDAFKKALELWNNLKLIKREPGSNPPHDAKYVHDRVYPP